MNQALVWGEIQTSVGYRPKYSPIHGLGWIVQVNFYYNHVYVNKNESADFPKYGLICVVKT